jgi:hypothetical protein
MGFMTAVATGFVDKQNSDLDKQQTQQDDLTKLNLQNVLKNVDNYNKSKAAYTAVQSKAASIAGLTKGDPNSIMTMLRAGVPDDQIMMAAAKNGSAPPAATPGNVDQQTTSAMGTASLNSANPATTPDASAVAPVSPTTPPPTATPAVATQAAPNAAEGMVKPTLWDHMFGTDPSAGIGQKADAQASAITGLSGDQIAQAHTGQFTPPAIAPGSMQMKPSDLVDWSKFDPSKYSSDTIGAAHSAFASGDMGTAMGLRQSASDIEASKIREELARARMTQGLSDTAASRTQAANVQSMMQLTKPDGTHYTHDEAVAHFLKLDPTGGDVNPQNLDPDALYASLGKQDQTMVGGALTGDFDPIKGLTGMKAGPERARIFSLAKQLDPTFNMATPGIRQKALQDLLIGPGSNMIVAIGTAARHAADLQEYTSKLNNGSFTPLNDASIAWKGYNSDPNVSNAKKSQLALATETAKILKGTGAPAEGEIQEQIRALPMNIGGVDQNGRSNMDQSIAGQLKLGYDRLQEQAIKFNRAFGTNVSGLSLLDPESQAKYAKMTGLPVPEVNITDNPFANAALQRLQRANGSATSAAYDSTTGNTKKHTQTPAPPAAPTNAQGHQTGPVPVVAAPTPQPQSQGRTVQQGDSLFDADTHAYIGPAK